MEKNYKNNLNPEQEKYIQEKLFEKYGDLLKRKGIESISETEICNLAEFLIAEHPEKYAKSMGTENNYRQNENLQKIYAVIDKQKNIAVMINTNENGKVPEGEFGTYDLQKNEFSLSNEVKKEIVEYLGIGALSIPAQDEIVHQLFHDLKDMDQLATMDLGKVIEQRKPVADKLINQKIDQENARNGKTKEDRKALENASKGKANSVDKKQEEVKNSKLPEHIVKYCIMAGISVPKAVIDTKASEAADKIDEPRINRNGGNVTIIKARDDSKSTDKYLVFQDGKLIIPGNRDDKIDKVVGRTMQHAKNGTMIKPLEIDDEEQYFEYSDSQGLVIKEKIEESLDLSVDDLERYKREATQELEKYSAELYKIEETPFLSDAQKDELYIKANERFNTNNAELATKYNIDTSTMKEINLETDERTQEQVDKEQDEEPDAWEVPGKRQREQ